MASSEKTPLKTEDEKSEETFSSKTGMVCSCIGSAVGTGNIWRFPRVVAVSSGRTGSLCFLIVWMISLLFWSIPMLVIEYGVGRFTHSAVTRSFQKLVGNRFSWCGLWITTIEFCIGAYYTVIAGWCIYYIFYFMVYPLPPTYENSTVIFESFARDSSWPVLTQAVVVIVIGALLVKGVSIIERANLFLAPSLLFILFILFVWAAVSPNAGRGLAFLFSPDWSTMKNPTMWLEAASQNAFDTNAGTGVFISYAAYMSRKDPAVKLSVGIPIFNNIISLCCGMLVFSTAFSSLSTTNPNITDPEILQLLQTTGPASTGLTFVWLPVLVERSGTVGRIMVILFFTCLLFAATSSVIAIQEMTVHLFQDFGLPRKYGVIISQSASFFLGLGSSFSLTFLSNQDLTWGFALLLSGLMLITMVIVFGIGTFRQKLVNEYGINDWKVPRLWEYEIKFVAPALTVTLVLWWIIYRFIKERSAGALWFSYTSTLGVVLQWLLVFLLAVAINITLECLQPEWYSTPKIDPNYTNLDDNSSKSEVAGNSNGGAETADKPLELTQPESEKKPDSEGH